MSLFSLMFFHDSLCNGWGQSEQCSEQFDLANIMIWYVVLKPINKFFLQRLQGPFCFFLCLLSFLCQLSPKMLVGR